MFFLHTSLNAVAVASRICRIVKANARNHITDWVEHLPYRDIFSIEEECWN
jgi:hypothetical protein